MPIVQTICAGNSNASTAAAVATLMRYQIHGSGEGLVLCPSTTNGQTTTKSGKGNVSGVVSELSTFWTVKPGHEQELRAAIQRFIEHVRSLPPETNMRTGLRDVRFVIFDNGTRMLFATGFETNWDTYIDDAVLTIAMLLAAAVLALIPARRAARLRPVEVLRAE